MGGCLVEVFEEKLATQIQRWKGTYNFLKGTSEPSGVSGPQSENC